MGSHNLPLSDFALMSNRRAIVQFLEFFSNFAIIQLLQNTASAPKKDVLMFLSCFRCSFHSVYNLSSSNRTYKK